MIRLGMIGLSEGNGHPFSFSAILNGYSDSGFANSGWPGIHDYLKKREPSEFAQLDARVTHAWTQDPQITQKLCDASLIPNPLARLEDMPNDIDAVILARDDYELHLEMALPFLKRGIPVFVDKPLCADIEELAIFEPYLNTGKLVSFAGMRFATELDPVRNTIREFGQIRLVQATILHSWEKYGIHMIDAFLSLGMAQEVAISASPSPRSPGQASVTIELSDGCLVQINTIGYGVPRCFRFSVFGTNRIEHVDITNNFSMFKKGLERFVGILKGDDFTADAELTKRSIRLLSAGRKALSSGERQFL